MCWVIDNEKSAIMKNKKRVVKVSKIVTVVSLLLFSVMSQAYAKEELGVGVTCLFSDVPVDLFAEIAPVLDVTPDVKLDINGAIGFCYYFR